MSASSACAEVTDLSADRSCNLGGEQQEQVPVAEHLGELQPTSCEYVGADEVLVSLKSKTGEIFSFSLKTAMLVHGINLAVTLINSCTAQVFRDLDVF
ncbi:hypothetical protein SAMN05443248_2943 [Bradyrhizobium erythrophlei]|uniref:Uncharacterized protein n=2 Tax=Bradyrhizobium erythrophlei TaxID=1437360 RepID=A0A1M5ND31_9BRAD|nr:hypothetical protein SAMN05443248_2943 [Bradyrhizobium erythrophlei]